MEQDNKKFYWIKLRTDFFNQDTIDFLLQQENGCEYVVLYQMLCLKTANNNGRLETKINEVIIPYDVKKIVRDCKYFDYDTVVVALELYKKLGLVYETDDKVLKLSGYEYMIGSESATREAIKKRKYRAKLKEKDNIEDIKGTKCPTEYRDKSIEYRDIDINKDITTTTNIDIYKYIEDNFGRFISPIEKEKLDSWLLLFPEDVLKYAIELSVLQNKKTFSYFEGILNNWKSCGYKTLQEIKDNDIKPNKTGTTVPKWFDKKIESEEASKQEQQEMANILNKFGGVI